MTINKDEILKKMMELRKSLDETEESVDRRSIIGKITDLHKDLIKATLNLKEY